MEPLGRALVTGASRGIGRAVALELDRRGFDVTATMRNPADGADLPDGISVQRLDVTDPASIDIPEGLRVLVNNAGADCANHSVEGSPLDMWRAVFETNVFGLVDVTRRAIPQLRATAADGGGAVICNVTSTSLYVPMPFFAVYRASKAAVSAMGESLATELAPHGVRVLEIPPGPIDTDMLADSSLVPEGAAHDAYRALGVKITAAREGVHAGAVPATDAAAAIVDAILDDDAPLRVACDELGAGLLAGWEQTANADWLRSFLDGFRL